MFLPVTSDRPDSQCPVSLPADNLDFMNCNADHVPPELEPGDSSMDPDLGSIDMVSYS